MRPLQLDGKSSCGCTCGMACQPCTLAVIVNRKPHSTVEAVTEIACGWKLVVRQQDATC